VWEISRVKTHRLVLLTALAIVVSIWSVLLVPRLRLSRLEEALSAAVDAETAATISREILKSSVKRSKAVLLDYANEHELCEFDSTHEILLIADDVSGEIHVVYLGPGGTTGDPLLDEAVAPGMPETIAQSFTIGEPPRLFRGIHLVAVDEEQADFVLRPQAEAEWHRYSFEFAGGRLVSEGLHDLNETELIQWQNSRGWPQRWN
jgi:hypothetical protein